MKNRNLSAFYILSTVSAVLMLAYLFLTFLPIVKINIGDVETGLNVYKCAINYKSFHTNPLIMIGLIFTLLAMGIIFFVPLLSLFKRIKLYVLIFLSSMALPLLAFGAIVSVTTLPIYRAANNNPAINGNYVVLVFQGLTLFVTLLINVSMIFYLAIKLFKYSSFKRSKKEDKK